MIRLEDVAFLREGRTILDGVSWHVADGEHWALVGANGAGKTTLLGIVCGTLWPTDGEVTVLGKRYGEIDLRELRKRIGWFSSAIEQQVNPRERALGLAATGKYATIGVKFNRPTAADRRRAEELMAFMECDHVAGQMFRTLSQGERQKVLICRALMADPELLILDEPCTGLDLASRERLLASIEKLARRGERIGGAGDGRKDSRRGRAAPTLIVVTHHIEEIVPSIDRVMVLKDGRVAACGAKADVLRGDVLGPALGVDVSVRRSAGRYWVSLKGSG